MTEDKPEKGQAAKPTQPPRQAPGQRNEAGAAAKKSTAKTPPLLNDAVTVPASRSGRALAGFAFLVALAAVAVAAYSWWQQQLYQTQMEARLSEIRTAAAPTPRQELPDFSDELADHRAGLNQQQGRLENLEQRLIDLRRQVGEISHVSRQSWMLAEAEFLLRLANQRLILERDTRNAVALLQAADRILREVDDVNLYQVRGAIARELAALRSMGGVDVEGVYLELAALKDQVLSLSVAVPEAFTPAPSGEAPSEQAAESEGVFDQALVKLSDYLRISYPRDPVRPQLSLQQRGQITQSLALLIEQAQLALLGRKPALYRYSLSEAVSWIDQYFQLDREAQSVSQALQQLAQLEVAPEQPDISASLRLLKDYLSDPDSLMLPREILEAESELVPELEPAPLLPQDSPPQDSQL